MDPKMYKNIAKHEDLQYVKAFLKQATLGNLPQK